MKITLLLLLINSLTQSFEYRVSTPPALFPYYYAVSDTSPLGNLSNPAYLPLWSSLYCNINYAKPYLMEELNSCSIRTGYGFENLALQAAWSRFGIREYNEDILEGNIGYRPWKLLSFGLGISYYHININAENTRFKYGITDFKFSALFLPFEYINFGYSQENINSLISNKEDREDFLYPSRSLGIAIKPAKGITFAWNINRIYYGYINTITASTNLLQSLSLKGGYSPETSSYSFAVILIYSKLLISYGLSYHTYLGSTHKVGLTITTGDFFFEEVSYNKKLFRQSLPEKQKKINVNSSTAEELAASGLFPGEIADRIIKYREVISPITEKGLVQIGLSEQELVRIRSFLTGVAEEPENEFIHPKENNKVHTKINKIKPKSGYDIGTRKSLFTKLLENDINAETALKIAEDAKSCNKDEIILRIKEIPDINEEKKKAIIKLCAGLL